MQRKNGRLAIDKREAKLVQEAFARFDDYSSTRQLCVALEKEGKGKLLRADRQRHEGRRLSLWFGTSMSRMFYNPIYAGFQKVEGELIKSDHEAYITLERWHEIQKILASRTKKSGKADTGLHVLSGLLFDDSDRILAPRMRGCARWPQRYYETDSRRLRKGSRLDRLRVRADELEKLVKAAIVAFLLDPEKLRVAVIRTYSDPQLAFDMQTKSPLAADRLQGCFGQELRNVFESLLSRVEVASHEVRIWVSLRSLDAYLSWNGIGLFRTIREMSQAREDLHLLQVEADLAPHRVKLRLPLEHHRGEHPDPRLIRLLKRAAEAEARLLADPTRDLEAHADAHKLSLSKYSRLLRLNYLAPDIKAAILDGRQPPDLTERKLLYSPIPADWRQQRSILGFKEPATDRPYLIKEGSRGNALRTEVNRIATRKAN